MNTRKHPPGFAPDDLADGRERLDWKTQYTEREARRNIRWESAYVAGLLFAIPIVIVLFWLEAPRAWLGIGETNYGIVCRYAYAWLGGTFGGVLFDIKWLYHTVAKGMWHLDRRLWRLFTPHLSGGLAFVVVLLISSGMLQIFDMTALKKPSSCLSIGFLVGYFSDAATAKLAEVAKTLFGMSEQRRTSG